MPIRSDVDQILLSKFTSTTSDSPISDQLLMSKGTGSLCRKIATNFFKRILKLSQDLKLWMYCHWKNVLKWTMHMLLDTYLISFLNILLSQIDVILLLKCQYAHLNEPIKRVSRHSSKFKKWLYSDSFQGLSDTTNSCSSKFHSEFIVIHLANSIFEGVL